MSEKEAINVRDLSIMDGIPLVRSCPRLREGDELVASLDDGSVIIGNPNSQESHYKVCRFPCEHFRHELSTVCLALKERRDAFIDTIVGRLKDKTLSKDRYNSAFRRAMGVNLNCKFHYTRGTVGGERVMVRVVNPTKSD